MFDLHVTWYLLIGVLLTGYAILDGFDLGVGILHFIVAKNDGQRRTLLNAIGPVWDGNEVWLLTGGGAIFAAFPPVYATVFSGFYLALVLLLAALMFRAVSIEFRSKEESPTWRRFWDSAFAIGSTVPALLFGVAIGNIVRGIPLTEEGEYAGTFLMLLNPFALVVGLLAVAMFTLQGAAWLLLKTEGIVRERAKRAAAVAFGAFVGLWLVAAIASRWAAPHMWEAYQRPAVWMIPAVFVATLFAIFLALRGRMPLPLFAFTSLAIVLLMSILGTGLFPYMVPALGDLTRSLTIYNASSSQLTLKTMLVIALIGMPLVLAYTIYIYRRFRGPVVMDEHSY